MVMTATVAHWTICSQQQSVTSRLVPIAELGVYSSETIPAKAKRASTGGNVSTWMHHLPVLSTWHAQPLQQTHLHTWYAVTCLYNLRHRGGCPCSSISCLLMHSGYLGSHSPLHATHSLILLSHTPHLCLCLPLTTCIRWAIQVPSRAVG